MISINSYEEPYALKTLVNIKGIYSVHYFEFKSDFSFEGEKHDFWELVYIDKGSAIAIADNQKITLSQGEIIFHKPNEFHSIAAVKEDPPSVFIITFECNSKCMEFFENKHMSLPSSAKGYITEIISEANDSFYLDHDNPYTEGLIIKENCPLGSQQLIKLNLEAVLIKLIRFQSYSNEHKNFETYSKITNQTIEILKNSIYGKVSVQTICDEVGFSRAHISSIFKNDVGKTITEYLTDLKIEEAKYLLRKGLYTVTEISDFLSFENPQYFCRVFKKETNMTPSQFLKSVTYKPKQKNT